MIRFCHSNPLFFLKKNRFLSVEGFRSCFILSPRGDQSVLLWNVMELKYNGALLKSVIPKRSEN